MARTDSPATHSDAQMPDDFARADELRAEAESVLARKVISPGSIQLGILQALLAIDARLRYDLAQRTELRHEPPADTVAAVRSSLAEPREAAAARARGDFDPRLARPQRRPEPDGGRTHG